VADGTYSVWPALLAAHPPLRGKRILPRRYVDGIEEDCDTVSPMKETQGKSFVT
jgi:hypothetical protein